MSVCSPVLPTNQRVDLITESITYIDFTVTNRKIKNGQRILTLSVCIVWNEMICLKEFGWQRSSLYWFLIVSHIWHIHVVFFSKRIRTESVFKQLPVDRLIQWCSHKRTLSHGKEGRTSLRRHGWILIFCRRFTKFIKFLLSGPTLKTTLFSRESVCAQSAETDRVHKHQHSLLHILDGWWCGRKRGSRDAGWKNEKAKRTNEGCGRTDGGHDGTYGNWGVSHTPRLSVDPSPGKQLINTDKHTDVWLKLMWWVQRKYPGQ